MTPGAERLQSSPTFRHAFIIKDLVGNIYRVHMGAAWKKKSKNKERGMETEMEGACVACGGHYFRCASRLAELENIILSG